MGNVIDEYYHCVTTKELTFEKMKNSCHKNARNADQNLCIEEKIEDIYNNWKRMKRINCFPSLKKEKIYFADDQSVKITEHCTCCTEE